MTEARLQQIERNAEAVYGKKTDTAELAEEIRYLRRLLAIACDYLSDAGRFHAEADLRQRGGLTE